MHLGPTNPRGYSGFEHTRLRQDPKVRRRMCDCARWRIDLCEQPVGTPPVRRSVRDPRQPPDSTSLATSGRAHRPAPWRADQPADRQFLVRDQLRDWRSVGRRVPRRQREPAHSFGAGAVCHRPGHARDTEAARRDGFTGRLAIHPAQVPIINDVFTPTSAEIEKAKT